MINPKIIKREKTRHYGEIIKKVKITPIKYC